jgi:hypothetical protein
MKHRLPAMAITIENNPVPILGNASLASQSGGDHQHPAGNRFIFFA